jgi:hypothetical protein
MDSSNASVRGSTLTSGEEHESLRARARAHGERKFEHDSSRQNSVLPFSRLDEINRASSSRFFVPRQQPDGSALKASDYRDFLFRDLS